MSKKKKNNYVRRGTWQVRWLLLFYDVIVFVLVGLPALTLSGSTLEPLQIFYHILLALGLVTLSRFGLRVYSQIWRYGGVQPYLRLMLADGIGFVLYYLLQLPIPITNITFIRAAAFISVDFIVVLGLRLSYRFIYKCLPRNNKFGKFIIKVLNFFGRTKIKSNEAEPVSKIKLAIIGAGSLGSLLVSEINNNENSPYVASCYIDTDPEKVGRIIYGVKVLSPSEANANLLKEFGVQEVVFAINNIDVEHKKELFNLYQSAGFRIKTYDYPTIQNAEIGSKRQIRSFDAEELLFRRTIDVIDESTKHFYENKVVLITGGGGSIGSEICRQIAKMNPKKIVILDVYENGAYDLQQELKMKYGQDLNIEVEILSICNKTALERVYQEHKPNIVVMAAAHKHVPLMEHNVIEAVENNVFGTLNTVELAEKYHVDRVHMVSTDKAVNPTSIMGATKRICEMIVQAHSTLDQHTTFSITRFGNVLGSAGSVIPLFKRQIANGGPVTLTDYRIIRYFMTIPEASQLVLCSASMAKNGELFVLDMGQPVKIYDLAVNMIRLSGFEPNKDIQIVETGLRPGEKLYEELLVKTEELDKTDNSLIFIERDKPLSLAEVEKKLNLLQEGIELGSDSNMKDIIKKVVPTFVEKEIANQVIIQ